MSPDKESSELTIFVINGCWHFDPKRNMLRHHLDGRAYELEHQLVVLLVYFITHQQQVLTKEQLLKDNWPGKVVNDENLTVAVSKLRKHFADSSKQPEVIKTIPGTGYQFVAEAQRQSVEVPRQQGPKANYLLPVSLSAVFALSFIGLIWYFGESTEVSQSLPVAHSTETSAIDALAVRSEQAHVEEIPLLVQAWHSVLQNHPDNAAAYWYLAKLKIQLLGPWVGERIKHFDELSALLAKALELDPDNAEAWYWLGNLNFWHKLAYSEAEAHLLRAISLKDDPRYYIHYSELLVAQGKFAEVFELAEQVRKNMPYLFAFPGLAWVYQLSGQPEKGWLELQRIRQTESDSYPWHCSAVRIAQQLGFADESLASLLWLLEQTEEGSAHTSQVRERYAEGGLATVYHYLLEVKFSGDVGHYLPPLSWARYAIIAGDPAAESYFQQAVEKRQLPLLWAGFDPLYASLHNSQPFLEWLEVLNLSSHVSAQAKTLIGE